MCNVKLNILLTFTDNVASWKTIILWKHNAYSLRHVVLSMLYILYTRMLLFLYYRLLKAVQFCSLHC